MNLSATRVADAKLTHPIRVTVFESNLSDTETVEIQSFGHLIEWFEYECESYVASREFITFRLNSDLMRIATRGGKHTFSLPIRDWNGKTTGQFTRYTIEAI